MNHHRREQIGGADTSRIKEDPTPLTRAAIVACDIAEGEVA
jgi:hypothetical protein